MNKITRYENGTIYFGKDHEVMMEITVEYVEEETIESIVIYGHDMQLAPYNTEGENMEIAKTMIAEFKVLNNIVDLAQGMGLPADLDTDTEDGLTAWQVIIFDEELLKAICETEEIYHQIID